MNRTNSGPEEIKRNKELWAQAHLGTEHPSIEPRPLSPGTDYEPNCPVCQALDALCDSVEDFWMAEVKRLRAALANAWREQGMTDDEIEVAFRGLQ